MRLYSPARMVTPRRNSAGRCAIFLLAIFGLLFTPDLASGAQESAVLQGDRFGDDGRIIIGETVTFQSEVYGGDRMVLVYLPEDYARSRQRYPVVYLLDGYFFFLPAVGVVDFYSAIDKMPKMIVAAVVSTNRMREFSTAQSGGAAEFTTFLRDELFPFMDERFRTEPFNILVGHSLGGLFAVHSFINDPSLFDAHIAASPALYWNGRSEVARAREVLGSWTSTKNFLYMTYSGGDGDNIRGPTDAVVSILRESNTPGLEWDFEFLPDDRHNSSPMKSILGGLERLFAGWAYRGGNSAEELAEHYRALTERFGFECRPSKDAVASRARTLVRQDSLPEAIEVYRYNVSLYPDAADVHEALGRTYLAAGENERAIESFEMSLELNPENPSVLQALRQLKGERGAPVEQPRP